MLQNAEITMISLAITTSNHLQWKPLGCMASPLAPFLSCLAKKLVYVWWPQGATVVPPAPVSGCGHR